jgi:hypothetical protein
MGKKKNSYLPWREARGRVYITGKTVHYIVENRAGEVLFYDNTGVEAWRKMFLICLARTDSANHLYGSERKIKPYNGYIG